MLWVLVEKTFVGSSCLEVFCKNGFSHSDKPEIVAHSCSLISVLENYVQFTGKHLFWSLLKLQGFSLQLYVKKKL